MGVLYYTGDGITNLHEGFHKWGGPQIIDFNCFVHHKPSILGYAHVWNPPYMNAYL
jgi:hypothetical protein